VTKDPVALALLMVMAWLLGLQLESLALIAELLVPPPLLVSGGENDTLADTEHVTEPGAAPENLGALVLAATGDAVANMTTTTDNMAVKADRRAVEEARRCARETGRRVMSTLPSRTGVIRRATRLGLLVPPRLDLTDACRRVIPSSVSLHMQSPELTNCEP